MITSSITSMIHSNTVTFNQTYANCKSAKFSAVRVSSAHQVNRLALTRTMAKIITMRKDNSEFTQKRHLNNSDLMLNYKGALIYSFLLL